MKSSHPSYTPRSRLKRRFVSVGAGIVLCTTAQAQSNTGQPLQLASREPAFYAIVGDRTERADARSFAVLRERIILRLHHATIPEALTAIEEQTPLRFAFKPSSLPAHTTVSLDARDITVAAAITQILLDADVDVELTSYGLASIVPREQRTPHGDPLTGMVVGRVVDAKTRGPISGATVSVEGTGLVVTTSDSGAFHLAKLTLGPHMLTVRRLGYLVLHRSLTVDGEGSTTITLELQESPNQLDQVVVTGSLVPTEVKALPTPITVVTAADIQQQQPHTVAELFRQAVPGAVSWDYPQDPEVTTFSVRGASTLQSGVGQMKVFVDGIESANMAFAAVDPNSIQRIEVIRGPEAAAIYGSDAIGGAIQIFTKHGDPAMPRPQVDAQVATAVLQTPYPRYRSTNRQTYSASVRGGSPDASYALGGSFERTGAYLPDAEQSSPSVYGSAHIDLHKIALDVSGRDYVENTNSVFDPALYTSGLAYYKSQLPQTSQYQNQTFAGKLTATPTDWLESSLALGLDRYATAQEQTRAHNTYPGDTLLFTYDEADTKTSERFTTTLHGVLTPLLGGSLTAGVEHYTLPVTQFYASSAFNNTGTIMTDTSNHNAITGTRTTTNNTGEFVQGQLSVSDALFLTAGIRVEQNSQFGDSIGSPISPRFGLSYARELGNATVLKFRASYGSGIRPPNPGEKLALPSNGSSQILANSVLGPERQRGFDGGADLSFGSHVSLGATYYNQTADNLIQLVQLSVNNQGLVTYQWQNVGRVRNSGFELESGLNFGFVSLKGQYSHSRSEVLELGSHYTGDLRVGDQTLDVPRNTAGASVTIVPVRRTSLSAGLTYVGSWREYDDLGEFRCLGSTGPCPASFTSSGGVDTRAFIINYPNIVKVNANLTEEVVRQLSVFVSVDNIANTEQHEQANFIPIIGRITTVGLRIHY